MPQPIKITPKSLATAKNGVGNTDDLNTLMLDLITDTLEGTVPPNQGNVICKASNNILKAVEMRHRLGTRHKTTGVKTLSLIGEEA